MDVAHLAPTWLREQQELLAVNDRDAMANDGVLGGGGAVPRHRLARAPGRHIMMRHLAAERPQVAPGQMWCVVCLEPHDAATGGVTLADSCGHAVCRESLASRAEARARTGEHVECFECRRRVSTEALVAVAPEQRALLERRAALEADPSASACTAGACTGWSVGGSAASPEVACRSCGTRACFLHDRAHAAGDAAACAAFAATVEQDAGTRDVVGATTKPCPRCGWLTERNGGCPHMQCVKPTCAALWCWGCSKLHPRFQMGRARVGLPLAAGAGAGADAGPAAAAAPAEVCSCTAFAEYMAERDPRLLPWAPGLRVPGDARLLGGARGPRVARRAGGPPRDAWEAPEVVDEGTALADAQRRQRLRREIASGGSAWRSSDMASVATLTRVSTTASAHGPARSVAAEDADALLSERVFGNVHIDAELRGVEGTHLAGCTFRVRMSVPAQYPFVGATYTFIDVPCLFHPNVGANGRVCGWPTSQGWGGDHHNPAISLDSAMRALQAMLAEPDLRDPAGVTNADAALAFHTSPADYALRAREAALAARAAAEAGAAADPAAAVQAEAAEAEDRGAAATAAAMTARFATGRRRTMAEYM